MDRIVFDTPVGPMALEGEGNALTALYLPNTPMAPAGEETSLLAWGRAELLDYLADFGLYREHLERHPIQLSGGELQRAMVARVMLLDPKLIVLDEPTSMLDTISQAQVLRMLEALQRQRQVSYLYITHSRCLADHLCQRIYYLDGGQLREEPFPAEICHQSSQKKEGRKFYHETHHIIPAEHGAAAPADRLRRESQPK